MRKEPLQYYVNLIENDSRFSLARYGDGELYCMWGRKGGNSNGCRYSPELRESLLQSMRHEADDTFIYGLQRVLPPDEKRIMEQYPGVQWFDSEIFGEAVAAGELYPLIKALRNKEDVLVISNESVKSVTKELIDWAGFHEVPKANAYDVRHSIISVIKDSKPKIVLFSCGMAANAIIGELHGTIDATMIDLGHIWDPFTGNMSRCDLEGKTMEDINKNLHA